MEETNEETAAPVETVEVVEVVEVPPTPVAPAEPVHPIAALPRYTHGLAGQSLVGSKMVPHAEGEWIRRDDVLKLL